MHACFRLSYLLELGGEKVLMYYYLHTNTWLHEESIDKFSSAVPTTDTELLSIEDDCLFHKETHVYVDTQLYRVYAFRTVFDNKWTRIK